MYVVNVDVEKPTVYIGRANSKRQLKGSPLGNPHPVGYPCRLCHGKVHERGETIVLYEAWLKQEWLKGPQNPARIELKRIADMVQRNEVVTLGCFCAPLPCHGDVVMKVVMKIITGCRK